MWYVAVGSTVVALVSLAYAVTQRQAARSFKISRNNPESQPETGNSAVADNTSTAEQDDRDLAERTKITLKGLLDVVANSVTAILDRTDRYGEKLNKNRDAISQATSLENIKNIETELLDSIDRLQQANADYRKELSAAHEQIAEQREQLDKLEVEVATDFLTGLPNRRTLSARLGENIARSNRYGAKFSLVIVDIDHFKKVNDKYGHIAGDRVLKAVASLLGEHMRSSDILARYGGEEFVMILPETTVKQAEMMADRMRKHIENAAFKYADETIHITVSAGVGEVHQPEDTTDGLFSRVDTALYEAKQSGRNRVVCAA